MMATDKTVVQFLEDLSKNIMIAVIYNGGAYGTYLEWVLTTLTTDTPIIPPFTNLGNSHKFLGNLATNIGSDRWNTLLNSKTPKSFIRVHPKTLKDENLSDNLTFIINSVELGIYLYPSRNTFLLNVNNYYSKIWDDWWTDRLSDSVFYNNLYDNFPIDKDTPMSKIPIWIKRELLSFNLMPSWFDQVEWYHPDTWSHPRCQLVSLNDLLYNFKNTILKIKDFCNLDFKKSIDVMIPHHNTMLSLQQSLGQDQLCNKIVDSIINNQVFEWEDQELPLPSQSWIQWQLRNLGYELKCHGLDIFPTNTTQLRKLLTTQHTDVIINNTPKD